MPAKKTFQITTCGECAVCFPVVGVYFTGQQPYECRLNPPVPISAHSSAYPQVRQDNPACFAGIKAAPKPVEKKAKAKKGEAK